MSYRSVYNHVVYAHTIRSVYNRPPASASPTTPLLLDAYPNAVSAFSTRKLRTGADLCCRVRRSSDNSEQDIGFSAVMDVNGNRFIDTVALLAFVGAGNGFVSVWYDSSISGIHGTQTTAASQPFIVTAGVVNLTTAGFNKPTLYFSSKFLTTPNPGLFNNVGYAMINSVYERLNGTGTQTIIANSISTSTTGVRLHMQTSTGNCTVQARRLDTDSITTASTPIPATLTQLTGEVRYSSGNMETFVNGSSSGAVALANGSGNTTAADSLTSTRIAAGLFAGVAIDGNLAELVIYTTPQSGNLAAIVANQRSAFGVP